MGAGYLEYVDIKSLHSQGAPVQVKCYTNGLWWVCPDPRDTERCSQAEKLYSSGHYINYEIVCITQQQLEATTRKYGFTSDKTAVHYTWDKPASASV